MRSILFLPCWAASAVGNSRHCDLIPVSSIYFQIGPSLRTWSRPFGLQLTDRSLCSQVFRLCQHRSRESSSREYLLTMSAKISDIFHPFPLVHVTSLTVRFLGTPFPLKCGLHIQCPSNSIQRPSALVRRPFDHSENTLKALHLLRRLSTPFYSLQYRMAQQDFNRILMGCTVPLANHLVKILT